MPRISFDQQFKSADTERFPKFKLDLGEKARIWLPEDPWMEWYHRIEAPMIENSEPVMELKETRRGPVEIRKMDWIGNVFCLGETGTPDNPGPLMLAGIDPENCPACESAANKTGVAAPQQRLAANIVKYKVRGRGSSPYDLASPISAEILIWATTSRIYGSLHELQAEHGDLRRHDIKIELEDSPGADKFQKIKTLAIIVQPAHADPKVREYVAALWKNQENRATDEQLRDACLGRDVPRLVMMDMVRRAEKQFRQVEQAGSGGGDTGQADVAFNGDLASGVDALLGSGSTALADPWVGEDAGNGSVPSGGGMEEFMTEDQRKDVAEAKQQAQREVTKIVNPDPFGDETPTVGGVTTTSTPAPAAEKSSRTAPKSAGNVPGSEAPAENGSKKAKAESAEQPSLTPEPVAAAAPSGGVIDFDDLFAG